MKTLLFGSAPIVPRRRDAAPVSRASRARLAKKSVVDRVWDEEQLRVVYAVVPQVLTICRANVQVSVDPLKKPPIREVLCGAGQRRPLRRKLRVSAHKHGNSRAPACPDRLDVTLEIPTRDHAGVECAACQDARDLWRVASPECRNIRTAGAIVQPAVVVSLQQRDVPFKGNAEIGPGMIRRVLPVAVKDREIRRDSQRPKPGRLVLNRVACNDS